MVAVSLVSTLLFTTWLGNRMGLSPARSLLLGTGFAISGASAIAAIEDTARAEDEDIAAATAMVTLFGTAAVVLLPLLAGPLGLSDLQFGAWAGAGIHEVGQVLLAASPAGAAVAAIAVAVKLTRVLTARTGRGRAQPDPAGQDTGSAHGQRPAPPWCRCSCSASSPASHCAAPGSCPSPCSARSPTSRSLPWVPPRSAWAAASTSPPCSPRAHPSWSSQPLGTLFIAAVTLAGILLVTH